MPFGKSKGYCNQGSELMRLNEQLRDYRTAFLRLKERLSPASSLSENELEILKIVDEALSA